MKDFLINLLGRDSVLDSAMQLAPYREDYSEAEPVDPAVVAMVSETAQVQAIVRQAGKVGTAITPRVAGTNVGGLAIASPGGVILDLSRMNRIHELNETDMYAVIEPGVTQQQMKDYLAEREVPLTLGFSLAPPHTSVFANALLGGLTNRSLKYGDQTQWISGLEIVLSDGSLARTGSWALEGALPFAQVPFPALAGLFVGWAGTTGIATRMAFQLWPKHRLNRRLFILTYSAHGTFESVRRLVRREFCDDIGGLSWPSAKMMLGVKHPHPEPSPGEPTFIVYVDLTADIDEEMALKERMLNDVLKGMRKEGEQIEEPLDIKMLLKVNPAMSPFAEFPTDLEFLTNHGGGGLSWVGTYGPLSRFEAGIEAGTEIMVRHKFAPMIVARPMRGGHYGVLRFVETFDKEDQADVERVKLVNAELLHMCSKLGFVMYKTPSWAWEKMKSSIDPGMLGLMRNVKQTLDPHGIFNPGKLGL
ncbi:MAG: FAD-binding oxidoreductase [Planctomycetes bacterium]|nr:FAD-binding oxidoreductase [Planctomycetota bacterium]